MTEQGVATIPADSPRPEGQRLAGLVLVRIATDSGEEADVCRDLGPLLAAKAGGDVWRVEVSRLIAALVAGGLVERTGDGLRATPRGLAAAVEFLGSKKGLPQSFAVARDNFLVAKALEIAPSSSGRMKMLRKPDGLRSLIVTRQFGIKFKGLPSPSRLRSALAVKALERAFGNQIGDGLGEKSQLPAKASRMLASQLLSSGREHGTDGRLIAAFAAEAVGSRRADLKTLQTAVLRQFLGRDPIDDTRGKRRAKKGKSQRLGRLKTRKPVESAVNGTKPAGGIDARAASEAAPELVVAGRPGPETFAKAVLSAADETAEGWTGNRKAFISRVWAVISARHGAWALSEIEFKCMLTEAHRTGLVALASADLKEKGVLEELQASQVVYKNSVWHYVRAAE